jgi:hypothetical protein
VEELAYAAWLILRQRLENCGSKISRKVWSTFPSESESKEPRRKRRWKDPLLRSLHQDERAREEFMLGLNKIARHGARKILAEALEAEVQAYVEAARGEPNDQEQLPVHEKRLRHGARDSLWS